MGLHVECVVAFDDRFELYAYISTNLQLKQQRYRDGSPLLAMSSILRAVSIPFIESVCSLTFFFFITRRVHFISNC